MGQWASARKEELRLLQTDHTDHCVVVFGKKTIIRYLDLVLSMSDKTWPGSLPELEGRMRFMAY